jgi:hypothetical protein
MSSDMTSEQMQAKITAARREAEGLKDRIKRKKDDLADANRKLPPVRAVVVCRRRSIASHSSFTRFGILIIFAKMGADRNEYSSPSCIR